MTLIIMAVVAAPLLVMGIFMRQGKGLMLLAGYNTMTEEDREKIDKAALGRVAGNLLIRCGIEFLLLGLAIQFEQSWATGILFAVVVADPAVSAIWMSQKFRTAKQTAISKGAGIVAIIITAVALMFVVVLFVQGDRAPAVLVQGDSIKIEGMYGLEIGLDDVESVTLDNRSMKEIEPNGTRTNGYGGFGDVLKGNFRSKTLGKYMLFVNSDSAPTLLIERREDAPVYINMDDAGKTEALYEELRQALR
ncbi:DUF3784 domain-containing protein [Christensenellaceae bacterium OttesenSCG-928-K19]|nr:DUF3784 domain-containing protein [Christensenellaceae bacterium OttesenSCG-928-K19]